MFFLLIYYFRRATSELDPRPIAVKLNLPHDRNLGALYNVSPKIRGPSPRRNWGPKTCKIRRDFRQLSSLIANISGTGQDIQSDELQLIFSWTKKVDELWSTNEKVIGAHVDAPKWNFSRDYIPACRGCWPLKFLHALEIDQGLLAHTAGVLSLGSAPYF